MDNQNQQDPLGILGGQPKKVEQPDPLGILKKKASETALKTGGKAGTSVLPSGLTPSKIEVPEFKEQVTESLVDLEGDPIKAASSRVTDLSKLLERQRRAAVSTTAVTKPIQVAGEVEKERKVERIESAKAKKVLDNTVRAFQEDAGLSTEFLMRSGKLQSPEQIDLMSKDQLLSLADPTNETEKIAINTLIDKKDVRNSLSQAKNLEEAALLYAGTKDPQIARQIDITSQTIPTNLQEVLAGTGKKAIARPEEIFAQATRGRMLYQLLTNPVAFDEIRKNPKLNQELQDTVPMLLEKYPDFGKMYLGQRISQKMEDMGINNALLNVVSEEETDQAVDALVKEGKMSQNEKRFYEQNLRGEGGLTNLGRKILGRQIYDTPGLIESTLGGGVQGVMALGKGAAELTGVRKALVGEREIVGRDVAERDLAVNVRPKDIINEMAQSGGQFLGQSLSIGGGGKALTALKAIKGVPLASAVVGGLQAYANYMPDARAKFPGNEIKQRGYATILATLEGATENIFRDSKVVDGLIGKMKPEVREVIQDFTSKKISAVAAREAIQSKLKKALLDLPEAAKYYTKGVAENTAEEVAAQLGQQITSGVFEGKRLDEWINGQELFDTARQAALGSAFIAGLSTRADMAKNRGITAKMIYGMAENPEYWAYKIQEAASLDPDFAAEAQDKLENLGYAAKVYQEIQGTPMTEKQKIKYLVDAMDSNIKAKQAEAITDPVLKKKAQEEITAIQANQAALLEGTDDGSIEGDVSDVVIPEEKVKAGEMEEAPQVPAAPEAKQIIEVKSPKEVKQGDTIVWRGEDFTVEEVNPKGGFNLKNVKDPTWTVKDARVTDEEFGGKRGEVKTAPEAPIKETAKSPWDIVKEEEQKYREKQQVDKENAKKDIDLIKSGDEETIEKYFKKSGYKEITEVDKDERLKGKKGVYKSTGASITIKPSKADAALDTATNIYNKKIQGLPSFRIEQIVKDFEKQKLTEKEEEKTASELPPAQLKPKEYVVQEPTAGEVPVQPEAGVSEEVEGGVPPTEPPTTTEEGKAEGEEREMTGISNEEALKMRLAMELPVFEKPETETWDQLNEQADEEIRKGYNIEKLLEKLEKGTLPTSLEEVILAKYGATLANKFETTQDEQALKDYERLTNITNKIGTITARALNVRKFLASKEDTLADFFVLEKEETGVDELTEEQKATLIKEYNEIKAATEALQKKVEQLQEENARMLAGEVVTEETKKAKKTRKTSQDFAQERKQIVDDIRQKLKEARQQSKVAVVPYLNELIAISPDVAKLVKSLVEQGVIKLEDIVTEIHATLKEDIEGLTKKDVTDLIAGEYNRKKPTRGAIAEKIKDLKDEAKLITKLEKLQEAPLPKDPIKKIERSREIKQLKDKIKEHPNTKLSEAKTKIATQIKKLEKDLADGNYDKKPEKREVPLDKEGKELQKKLIQLRRERDIRRLKNEYEKRNKLQKAVDKVTEIANIPRSLMASTDFSAPLNQAIVATIAYPDLAKKATEQMIKATASQEAFDQWFYDLKDDPRYDLMKELKLRIADPHSPFLTAREEAFMSGYAEQIPGLGRLVKASERAYVQYLNKLRVDIFNRFVDRFEEQGKTYANSPKLYEATAKYINNITGSGKLPKIGSVDFEQFSPMFSALLFSPRLMAARINMLNPYYFATLPTELKVQYGKDMGKFLGLASTIITLFALYGKTQDDDDEDKITVETDPTSTDFARIKQGDTRWDILGGFQPYIRLMNQIGSGERKSTKTGLKQSLDGEGAFGMTRGDVLASFFRNKLAPVPSMTVNFIQGRNSIGEKVTLEKELFSHVIPLSMQTIGEAIKEGGPSKVVSAGLPAVFGIGVQTYGDRPKEVKEEIEYRNREVKLTKEQKKFFQDVYDEISKKNLDKLKASREYKSVERDVQVDLENIVKKAAMKKAETRLTQKYAKEFLKFPVIQEDRKVKSIKEKVKSQF